MVECYASVEHLTVLPSSSTAAAARRSTRACGCGAGAPGCRRSGPSQKTRIWLGSSSTAEAAARAYDAALLCLKGFSADLNFPVHLPAAAMSPKSIQREAAAAAAVSAVATMPPCSSGSASAGSSPETGTDESTAHEDDSGAVDYGALADVKAFFQSPKCMEFCMMDPCSTFFAPSPLMEAEWGEEEGEIGLWSFS